MSKDKQEQAGALLSVEEIATNQSAQNQAAANLNNETPPDNPSTSESDQDTGKQEAPVMPSKMTVDQYLIRAPQGTGISELVRSLYKTMIMSFEEWENTVKTLLKRQVR